MRPVARSPFFAALLSLAAAPVAAQSFGASATLFGDRVVVGEPSSERLPGAVYVYARSNAGWTEAARLAAGTTRTAYGAALASSDRFLFVGEPGAEDGGRVHVLEPGGGDRWTEVATLMAPGTTRFGQGIAAEGERLLVRARDVEEDADLVVVLRWSGDAYEPEGRLRGPEDTGFGTGLAVAGELAVVGAPAEEERSGAVYVFRVGAAGWSAAGRLTPPEGGGGRGAGFGAAVAIVDGEVWVGSPGADRATGRVERFAPEGDGWAHAGSLDAGLEPPVAFGAAIVPAGDDVLVGAPGVGQGVGRVFPVRRGGGGWTVGEGVGVEAEGRVQAGAVVAARGDLAVLGLPSDDFGSGAAWVATADAGWSPEVRLASEQIGLPPITGGQVDCEDGTAEGFDCEAVDLLSFVPREMLGAGRGSRLNDVWGWTDPETGREYAIVGLMDGTAFVDVSDPGRPRVLGNLPKHEGSTSNTWRDMKVYADHVFIVADGAGDHGMQVFDLRQLAGVTEPRIFEETAHYDRVASAHNIVINEDTGFGYIVGSGGGGDTCGGGLHMVDLREPTAPSFAGCFAHEGTGRTGTGYSHDAQCVAYAGPDADYAGREVCFSANETVLSIADVTDKSAPVAISSASYPNVGYAHQGWLSEDRNYFFSNDELDEVGGLVDATRTLVWDVRDLDDPTLVTEYFSPTRVTDHNMYVRGDRLYMSNNRSGLRVVDIGDPENPVEIGFFDTTPWSEDEAGFDGTWSVYPYFESGVILLSSRREGLFLVKPQERRLVP